MEHKKFFLPRLESMINNGREGRFNGKKNTKITFFTPRAKRKWLNFIGRRTARGEMTTRLRRCCLLNYRPCAMTSAEILRGLIAPTMNWKGLTINLFSQKMFCYLWGCLCKPAGVFTEQKVSRNCYCQFRNNLGSVQPRLLFFSLSGNCLWKNVINSF